MARIYLIGYRGTGKSTVGASLASSLSRSFHDLDACLCQSQGRTVAQIVAAGGWEEFRRLEAETLRAVTAAADRDAVLATGGGIILAAGNREFLRQHGLVFWLRAPEEEIARRLMAQPDHNQRPSLCGRGLLAEIGSVLREREALYAASCHYEIDAARNVETVCEELVSKILDEERHGQTRGS